MNEKDILLADLEAIERWHIKWYYYIPIIGFVITLKNGASISSQLMSPEAVASLSMRKRRGPNKERTKISRSKIIQNTILFILCAFIVITIGISSFDLPDDVTVILMLTTIIALAILLIWMFVKSCFLCKVYDEIFIRVVNNVNNKLEEIKKNNLSNVSNKVVV